MFNLPSNARIVNVLENTGLPVAVERGPSRSGHNLQFKSANIAHVVQNYYYFSDVKNKFPCLVVTIPNGFSENELNWISSQSLIRLSL